MKRYTVIAILLALFALPAQASITTYYWHQTAVSAPGLTFTGRFSVVKGSAPIFASSTDTPPDFGGLVDFDVEGAGFSPVTIADLTPSCSAGSCFPIWGLTIVGGTPFFDFLDADGRETLVAAGSFTTHTTDSGPCSGFDGCWATGFWSAAQVPAPATLPVLLGGLVLLAGLFRAGRGRIRS